MKLSGIPAFVKQKENIATRGWVNKACYLATPPHLPLGTGGKGPLPLAEAAPSRLLLLCNLAV